MTNELIIEMIKYYTGDAKRIQHMTKVYSYAKLIGEMENISEDKQLVLETAAIVHDIGIKLSEKLYNDSNGQHQEELGPGIAKILLNKLGYDERVVERVCFLVGHHHTYSNIDDIDYQILVEADFLVNFFEDECTHCTVINAYNKIFKTESGKKICREMYGLE